MNVKIILSLLSVFVMYTVDAFATIYNYTVSGEFQVITEENLSVDQFVNGEMQISDEFVYNTANIMDGVPYFDITSFNLFVSGSSGYNFSGDSGSLDYDHLVVDPRTGEMYAEEQWGLQSFTGDAWIQPFGSCIDFFTSEMIEYDPLANESFGVLAPIIALHGPYYATQYYSYHDGITQLNHINEGTIWLTRNAAPVPEPSTVILLVTGLLTPVFASRTGRGKEKSDTTIRS